MYIISAKLIDKCGLMCRDRRCTNIEDAKAGLRERVTSYIKNTEGYKENKPLEEQYLKGAKLCMIEMGADFIIFDEHGKIDEVWQWYIYEK